MLRRYFDKTFGIDCRSVVHEHFVDGFVIGIMRRLTEAERWRAIGMLQAGSTQVQTAKIMNSSQLVVSLSLSRAVEDLQRSGRTRSTSGRDDRLVVS